MGESKVEMEREYTSFKESFGRFKTLLDKIAYEVYQNSEDSDIVERVNLPPLFDKSGLNYNTFLQNSGYAKLSNYGGVWNVENKKAIKFNPEKYLRARNLSPNNEHYIEEIYE